MLTGASLLIWASGELTPTAVLALTISFGIAIDDTVHFLSQFEAAQAQGAPPTGGRYSNSGGRSGYGSDNTVADSGPVCDSVQ